MQSLLDEVSRQHFPNPPGSLSQIEEFERRVNWRLDDELRAFYLHCNGADLFKRPGSPYMFLPLEEIARARVVILGEDDDKYGPASLYAICDVQDGDYVLVDTETQDDGHYAMIDGWHEGFSDPKYHRRIARSFSEFLAEALRSGGRQFWLNRGGT